MDLIGERIETFPSSSETEMKNNAKCVLTNQETHQAQRNPDIDFAVKY